MFPTSVRRVTVDDQSGSGPEAAARQSRYTALLALIDDGDCLLSAHHEEDQAETLLLNLMRGSGLAGLAGIGAIQDFGRGRLLRPLLSVSTAAIKEYADRHNLDWIDDPSNADTRFDRNFLRREIVPALAARWPAVSSRLKQSADLAGEASALLRELANVDISAAGTPERLDLGDPAGTKPRTATQCAAPGRQFMRPAASSCYAAVPGHR